MNHKDRRSQTPPTLAKGSMTAQAGPPNGEKPKLFDSSIVSTAQQAVDFITNILESSTEYSVIAKDLEGKILLWNEGARRLYGYEPGEVVGRANSSILHVPEDVAAGVPSQIMRTALEKGKWEGTLSRQRKNGEQFTARLVITPRRDPSGNPTGFLLISKDISDEIRLTQYARSLIEASVDPLVTISPEGKITDVNEATIKVTGASREKLTRRGLCQLFYGTGKSSRRLPARFLGRTRHRLPSHDPTCRWTPDRRALQRLGLQGRQRHRAGRVRRRPRHHGAQEGRGEISGVARIGPRCNGHCEQGRPDHPRQRPDREALRLRTRRNCSASQSK